MIKNDIKEFIYWYFSILGRHKGLTVILIVLGSNIVIDAVYQPMSGEFLHIVYSNEMNSFVSSIAIIAGFLIQVLQIYQDTQKRAFIFQHFGISDAKKFDIASVRPIKDRLYIPEVFNLEVHKFYNNGSITDPQAALDITLSIKQIIDAKSRVEEQNSKYYYGGISQVPLSFVAGSILDNTKKIEVYDWDRGKEKTYPIQLGCKALEISCTEPDEVIFLNHHHDKIAIEIALTYQIDHENTKIAIGNVPTIRVEADTLEKDNTKYLESQEAISKKFHDILDKYSEKNVDEIHIFIAAQNSMVFQLGRQVSQRVHKKIVVWQFEIQNTPKNPWGVAISSDGYEIVKPE